MRCKAKTSRTRPPLAGTALPRGTDAWRSRGWLAAFGALLLLPLVGCTSAREPSKTARSAIEQLLLTQAAKRS